VSSEWDWANRKQRRSTAIDERRQQCSRRYRALRTRTRLPGAKRYHWQRRSIHPLRRLRDNSSERASVVKNSYARNNGAGSRFTKGVEVQDVDCSGVWGIPGHCTIDQKSTNAYGRLHGELMLAYPRRRCRLKGSRASSHRRTAELRGRGPAVSPRQPINEMVFQIFLQNTLLPEHLPC